VSGEKREFAATFGDDEVQLMAAICHALLTDGEIEIPADSKERERLLRVAAKFARMRAKLSNGGAW
jgi:hypothetical protein